MNSGEAQAPPTVITSYSIHYTKLYDDLRYRAIDLFHTFQQGRDQLCRLNDQGALVEQAAAGNRLQILQRQGRVRQEVFESYNFV